MTTVVRHPASSPDRPPTPVATPSTVTVPLVLVFVAILAMGAWLHIQQHPLWLAFGTPLAIWIALFGSARAIGRLRRGIQALLATETGQAP